MASIRVFLVFCIIGWASVGSSPLAIDVLESRDIIFPRRSELVKRRASNDVFELNHQKISLASFIENIETGILQTALSVEPLATSDAQVEVQNTSTSTSPHPIEIRATKEDTIAPVESSTAYVILQTTENVPAIDSVPSHVVIDRVSVFKAPEAGSGLFPTFLVQDPNATSVSDSTEANPEADDDDEEGFTSVNDSGSSECDEESESTESTESSEEKSSKVKCSLTTLTPMESSSTASPPPSTTTSTTTKLTVEEKKSVEKELKEKVGEVEAEPVIFTARV